MCLLTDLLGDGNATSEPSGILASHDPRMATGGVNIGTANQTHYYRITGVGVTGGAQTISKIGLEVTTSSGNICVSVYASSGTGRDAVPGARKATSGSVACPSAGYAEVTLDAPVTVAPGDWLAIACDNGTAQFAGYGGRQNNVVKGFAAYQNSAFPSPATAAPTGNGTVRNIPLVAVP